MKIGAVMFFTTDSMRPAPLAQALEPEHPRTVDRQHAHHLAHVEHGRIVGLHLAGQRRQTRLG